MVSEFDAAERVVYRLLPFDRIGVHKILMDGKADQIHSTHEGMALELLKIGRILAVHLTMKDVDPLHPQVGGVVDHRFNGHLGRLEMPVGVGGKSQSDAGCLGGGQRGCRVHGGCGQGGENGQTGCSQKLTATQMALAHGIGR